MVDRQDTWAGTFWCPIEGVHSPAELRTDEGHFMLAPDLDIVTSLCIVTTHKDGTTTTTVSGDPAKIVADFEPRILHGELSNGVRLTVLDAHLSDSFTGQTFSAHHLVWGAHLGQDPVFSSIRFEPPGSQRWSGLVGTAECDGPNPTGQLTGYVEDGHLWVEFTSARPMALAALESVVWHSADTLMSIWCNADLKLVQLQIRLDERSDWLDVTTSGLLQQTKRSDLDQPLLSTADLSLSLLANWLVSAAEFSPIPFMVRPGALDGIALQTQVLIVASALEGLHRRTHPDQNYFQALPKARMKEVRDAALEAALTELEALGWDDIEGARARVRQSLNHMGQTTLADRLRVLAFPVADVAPGLLGPSLEVWVTGMKNARNGEGHQLDAAPEFGSDKIDPYYQLLTSGKWVARISLLLQMGVEPATLTAALHAHQRFLFELANMDTGKDGWPGSALETFRLSASGEDEGPSQDREITQV